MKAKCVGCGQVWNISVLQKIPKSGYVCPHCEGKRIREGKEWKKKEVEKLVREVVPDVLFAKALGYAERKQRYIYAQDPRPEVMQGWYLKELVAEYVRILSFSELTMDLSRALNMEKEHSAISQSAQSDIHIVTCPASGSNKKLQYGGKFYERADNLEAISG